jgi:hypothetical protein
MTVSHSGTFAYNKPVTSLSNCPIVPASDCASRSGQYELLTHVALANLGAGSRCPRSYVWLSQKRKIGSTIASLCLE